MWFNRRSSLRNAILLLTFSVSSCALIIAVSQRLSTPAMAQQTGNARQFSPVDRYLEAREHMLRMPHYSTARNRFLPAGAGLDAMAGTATWTELGPGNLGGRTRALVIHPTNSNVMYAASAGGGVWKTTNGGATWSPLTDLLPNLAVCALAMDPKNPDVLYAGTGENIYGRVSLRGVGVFKSVDGGANWELLAGTKTEDFHFVYDIVVSPLNSQRVYAATGNGVWRSLDGGANWALSLGDQNFSYPCFDLAIRADQQSDFLFAVHQNAIHRNIDAGGTGTWAQVFAKSPLSSFNGATIAIAPSNQNVVYALVETGEVIRSVSGGDAGTWTTQAGGETATGISRYLLSDSYHAFSEACRRGPNRVLDFEFNRGWYSRAIAVDPVDPNRVWIGGVDLFRSDDGGVNWGLASYRWADAGSPQYAHSDQHAIVFHPQYNGTTNQTLFVANDGGVYRANNSRAAVSPGDEPPCDTKGGAVAWDSLNSGYNVTQFYHGLPAPDGKSYLGGTQGNGLVRGTDAGGINGWKQILSGNGVGDIGYVAIDTFNPAIIYATKTNAFASVWKSTDSGKTFSQMINGVAEPGSFPPYFARLAMDPSDPLRLWMPSYILFRTDNGAARWNRADGPTGAPFIVVAPTDSNSLMTSDFRMLHLTSNGLAERPDWRQVNPRHNPVTNGADPISGAAFDPVDKRVAYIVYGVPGGKHIWKTTDAGETWRAIDGEGATGLPDVPVNCVAVDPNNTSRLYVGTDMGVFVSTDGGANWAAENTGFIGVVVESLAFNTSDGVTSLYAFTNGRGAWRVTTGAAGCQRTLSSARASFNAAGGAGAVNVSTSPGNCQWTAESNAEWISVTGGASGAGAGAVSYSAAANNTFNARVGTITIAGRSLTVTQAAMIDTTPPVVSIEFPPSNPFHIRSRTISLKFSITDNVGATTVITSNDRGGGGESPITNVGSSIGFTLQPGMNNLTVMVRDAAGNSGADTRSVIFTPEYTISTFAGTGQAGFSGDGGPASAAQINEPHSLAMDKAGNIYFTDLRNQRIRKVTPDGVVTTIAGNGVQGGAGDGGPAIAAQLHFPRGLVVDDHGDIYFIHLQNRIRKITASTGVISAIQTIGGQFIQPIDIALDGKGNLLVTDNILHKVVKVAPDGVVSTFAGTGTFSDPLGDGGPATSANVGSPRGIAVDKAGNVYIAHGLIRKITPDGIINTIAGGGDSSGTYGNGIPATQSSIGAIDVDIDEAGNLFISSDSRIHKVTPDGVINTVAGTDSIFYGGDGGIATSGSFGGVSGVAVDNAGAVYLTDSQNHRIRKLTPFLAPDVVAPTVTITAPTAASAWATLSGSLYLSGAAADNVLVTQVAWENDRGGGATASGSPSSWNARIALQPGLNNITVTAWDAAGNASAATLAVTYNAAAPFDTVSGKPVAVPATSNAPPFIRGGFSGDGGPASMAQLDSPRAVARDSAGNLYVADTANHRIRKITPDGVIRTFAGNGLGGSSGDGGPATAASLNEPRGLAVDAAGAVYIADTLNHRIRMVTPSGIISTIAGTGVDGFGGDGGAAASAQLSLPQGLATDGAGNLYIADTNNHRVRKVAAGAGVITTVVGNGYGFGGDNGPATESLLRSPSCVALDQSGALYVADSGNFRIRKVSAAGVITTIAGTGVMGFAGDNFPATVARLTAVGGLAVDASGAVYVADTFNHRVRRVTSAGVISTVVGSGTARIDTFGGEAGDALVAQLSQPSGLAIDQTGGLLIADTGNHRVLAVTLRPTPALATVSAASYFAYTTARDSINAAFGLNLSAQTAIANTLPLPTELADVSVRVKDFAGTERAAPLFFVSPGQVNFHAPPETSFGPATIAVANRGGELAAGPIFITAVSPGLFAANADGQGIASALVLRVAGDGTQSFEPVAVFDQAQNRFVARPIDLGPETDQVFLILFGSGIRGRSALTSVTAQIGGVPATVSYAGSQGGFVGLDQINLRLPRDLAERGEIDVGLTVDGVAANRVRVSIK